MEEGDRERRRHATRTLAIFPDDAGMYEVRGRLDPEVGALLMRALEAAGDVLYRVERKEPLGPEPPEAGQRWADALGLLAERAMAVGFGTTGQPDESEENGPAGPRGEEEEETAGDEVAQKDKLPPGPAGPPALGSHMGTRSERYQVFLYLDPEALAREGDPAHTHLEDGTRITADTARRLTCDGAIVPVLKDAGGKGDSILNVGRRTRTIPPAIRRALRIRDGGCRFPGCGLRFTEGHHIIHWSLGGPTSLENLVLLCRVHHRAVHDDGFRVERRRDGEFAFFSPEGWPLGQGVPRVSLEPGDPVLELIRQNRRRGIRPRWDAASADYAREVHIPDQLLLRAWEALEVG